MRLIFLSRRTSIMTRIALRRRKRPRTNQNQVSFPPLSSKRDLRRNKEEAKRISCDEFVKQVLDLITNLDTAKPESNKKENSDNPSEVKNKTETKEKEKAKSEAPESTQTKPKNSHKRK
mmetsp:Transcript_15024/g.17349  ORF Transcript_15024/g.17349 Transcript_15024/m.17349 type:complete len:119 (+) Transcript_15024:1139-1495(+)